LNNFKLTFIFSFISRSLATLMLIITWVVVNSYLSRENVSLYFLYMNILTFYGLVELGISQVGIVWMSGLIKKNINSNYLTIDNNIFNQIFNNIKIHFNKGSLILFFSLLVFGVFYYIFRQEIGLFNFSIYIIICILFCIHIKNTPYILLMEAKGFIITLQIYRIIDALLSYGFLIIAILFWESLICIPIFMLVRLLTQKTLIIKYGVFKNKIISNTKIKEIQNTNMFNNFVKQKKAMITTNIAGIIIFNTSIPYVYLFSDAKISSVYSQTFNIFSLLFQTLITFINNNLVHYLELKNLSIKDLRLVYIKHNLVICFIYITFTALFLFILFINDQIGKYFLEIKYIILISISFFILYISSVIMIYDRMNKVENFSLIGIICASIIILFYILNYSFFNFAPVNIAIYTFLLIALLQLSYSIYIAITAHDNT